MAMRYGVLSMLAMAALAFAQEPKAKEVVKPEPERKVFVLKYADAQVVGSLLLNVFPGVVTYNREMKVIAASGTPAVIAGVGEAIAKLDVPPPPVKNVEITGYLLAGSTKAEAGGRVPAELDSVVKQIRAIFPYKELQLLDSMVLRTQAEARHASLSGVVAPLNGEVTNISYQLKINSLSLTGEGKDTMIHLSGLELNMKVPVRVSYTTNNIQEVGMNTDIDVREGQKAVVGKWSFGTKEDPSSDKALFLVLTAKLVE
jgi:hypothetical protein